ncbi:unnamed protein product [marine sediment metagenome]|uniref:Uncharacterized protein n=1 Tax=marine sediment metagenome TaxID=412755 RepID=X0ZW53_9ZZZZ
MYMRRTALLKLKKPKVGRCIPVMSEIIEECLYISFDLSTIAGKLSGIGKRDHRPKAHVRVGSDESQATA